MVKSALKPEAYTSVPARFPRQLTSIKVDRGRGGFSKTDTVA